MILRIHGGIGNQLFQYAFILGLNNPENTRVCLSFYNGYMKYPRKPLKIYDFLSLRDTDYSPKPNIFSRLYIRFNKHKQHYFFYMLNERFGNVFYERHEYGFRKVLTNRSLNGVWLDGYFADFRYMIKGLERIKCAFEKLTTLKQLDYNSYVAVHIRRGDYTKINRTQGKSNVLEITYYKKCLELLGMNEYVIRIYTDDYVWAKTELPSIFCEYRLDFSPEYYSDIDSLWTMSKHEYLIGANSTFSLWAYYFGMDEMSKFYYPKEWAVTIEKKGYEIFGRTERNFQLVNEE
jgi:hypothetical protein